MWTHEVTATTSAPPADVWRVLADLDHWATWDTSMEWVRVDGAPAVGATVRMKPIGQDEIRSTITEFDPGRRYADHTEFAGLSLRFSHTLTPGGNGGTVVTHRLEITGDDATAAQVGPMITEDFPEATAALLAAAEAGAPSRAS